MSFPILLLEFLPVYAREAICGFPYGTKKATKGKGAASEPTRDEEWNTSKCSQADFESLVSQGLLVPRSVIQWRPALGSDHPYENTGEVVAFTSYLE